MSANPLHIVRLFRADRLRKQQREMRSVGVQPADYDQAANDWRFTKEEAMFWSCAGLAVVTFWLSVLGVI